MLVRRWRVLEERLMLVLGEKWGRFRVSIEMILGVVCGGKNIV